MREKKRGGKGESFSRQIRKTRKIFKFLIFLQDLREKPSPFPPLFNLNAFYIKLYYIILYKIKYGNL